MPPCEANADIAKFNPIFKRRTSIESINVAPYTSRRVHRQQQSGKLNANLQNIPSSLPANVSLDLATLTLNTSAKEIERQLTLTSLVRFVNSWLQEFDPEIYQTQTQESIEIWLRNVFQALSSLLECFGCGHFNETFLLATVLLVEKFVERNGPIRQVHLFDVLLISTLVTVKMWEDCRISNHRAAAIIGIPLQTINQMERVFLGKIDYCLYISNSQLQSFKARI
jgi:hypothetical protein